jgi:hypothetical protein
MKDCGVKLRFLTRTVQMVALGVEGVPPAWLSLR